MILCPQFSLKYTCACDAFPLDLILAYRMTARAKVRYANLFDEATELIRKERGVFRRLEDVPEDAVVAKMRALAKQRGAQLPLVPEEYIHTKARILFPAFSIVLQGIDVF